MVNKPFFLTYSNPWLMAGLRVVRGPDWEQGNSDGGEGHLGTVVSVSEKDGVANVVWDIGKNTTCRIGKDGKYDLRVLDNASIGIVFRNKKCSQCKCEPFYGMCWECKTCKDTNICSLCYFRDKHNTEHEFVRYTMPNANGEELQKRSISVAMRSFGMYPGAKVIRGRNWEYDNQDGGSGSVGTVRDIRSVKKDMSHRNGVGVTWPSGKFSTYRIGYKGKVDLVCKNVARGFGYYRDHLPLLDYNMIKDQVSTQSTLGVSIGDDVCITVSVSELKEAQKDFGGYHEGMKNAIGKRGVIDGFTDTGGVIVKYQDDKWVFNPKVLSKVWNMAIGDTVLVKNDQQKVEFLQKFHEEWNPKMINVLGKVGKIVRITHKQDAVVSFGTSHLVFNMACLVPCPGAQVDEIEDDEIEDEEDLTLSLATVGLANGMGLLLAQLRIFEAQTLSPDHFLRMAADGNDKIVSQMVKGEPNLCNMQIKGTTALIAACFEGHDGVVKVLISNGVNVNQTDQNGNTALLASVSEDQSSTVRILLDAGCDVNASNKHGRTAIHVAARFGFEEPAKLLIAKDCNVNVKDVYEDTPLHNAIENGQDDLIALIADVKGIDFRMKNEKGFNALIFAAFKGNKTATNKITAKCPEMTNESNTNNNNTALHVAALNNRTEIATVLLLQGRADAEKKNKDGRTPLHLACFEAYYDMVKILLDHGASVTMADKDGNTAMHCTLGGVRSQPAVLILMGHRVQTKTERVKIACMLLGFGAKINTRNKQGQQAIDLADADVKTAVTKQAEAFSTRKTATGGRDRPSSGRQEKRMFQQEMVLPCLLCFRETGSVTNDPCGHRCLCTNCCFRTDECPACLQEIDRRLDSEGNVLQPVVLDICKVQ